APPFCGGIFGYLAYDAVHGFEKLPGVPGDAEVPDAVFFEPEVVAVFDNRHHSLTLYGRDPASVDDAAARLRHPLPARPPASGWREPTVCDPAEEFEDVVRAAQEEIRAGEIIQVVLSRRFELEPSADPFDVYRGLRAINPSPYLYYLDLDGFQIAGASPEVMIRVLDGTVTVRPIAGTRPRGTDAADDARLAKELLADHKERAEHIMLVDLGRNDVGRISTPGTVRVTDLMVVERYSHVMHIVSEVQGDLDPKYDAYDALRAAFPAGTLSGAPKVRAMEIIDRLEKRRRGIYGGAVGYFGPNGDADFGITIRTMLATPERFVIQAGAGIVADSDPQREAEETEHKARAVMRAVRWAATVEAGTHSPIASEPDARAKP
ncbi:MAG: anthranilate synthase component I family protein, partial [Myxococcota bacterium]